MAVLAASQRGLHVALEQRGERLLVLPLRMLRRERLHAVEREEQLEIHRLLGPERAVVVERGDALGTGTKSGEPALLPSQRKSRWTVWPCRRSTKARDRRRERPRSESAGDHRAGSDTGFRDCFIAVSSLSV